MNSATPYNTLTNSEEDSNVHLVISCISDNVYIKPSRPVNRQRLIGILMDAMYCLQHSEDKTIHPDDCRLRVLLTVDDEQVRPDPME